MQTPITPPNRPFPTIGSPVPDTALPASGGQSLRLGDFAPRPLVFFTYSKAGTPSCDNAIADFAALVPAFTAAGVAVMGLSKDSPAALDRYLAKHGYQITLASDQAGQLMEDIGAFGDKIFMGKPVRGVLRSTFLIDAAGCFAECWSVDRVKGHAAMVLEHVVSGKGV